MPLPDSVRVKLSSEAAESISITPVVVRDIPIRELIEQMLGVTGKDSPRLHELLLRGTLVSGGSRFRWRGWDANHQDIQALLETFPDRDPQRPFSPDRCIRAALRGPGRRIEIPREVGLRKPDPAIYRYAADGLRVDPAACLYCGDGAYGELAGAASVGMTSFLIADPAVDVEESLVPEREEWDGARVTDLRELLALLPALS